MLRAGGAQQVQGFQVQRHVAVGRVNHGRAAAQNVVAAEQQLVFQQHQAQVVGSVARCVQHLQRVRHLAILRLS